MVNAVSPGILGSSPGASKINPTSRTFPEQVWGWLACFRSVHLAITLLTLLMLGVFAGVMIPQEGLVELADIKTQFGENYRVMKAMGLFNVYSSYWFLTLEVLFFFNLLFGSFQWLRPAFLAAVRKEFSGPEHIRVSPRHFWVRSCQPAGDLCESIQQIFKKKGYRVWVSSKSGPWRLYASKASFSRLGPAVAHFGILCLLLASVYGAFTGFTAQKLAVPGETFSFSAVDRMMPKMDPPFWQGTIPDWQVTVQDFNVDFYEDRPETVRQYFADLELTNNREQTLLAQKQISVNHPLSHGDVTIYQASFAPTGKLFMMINGERKTVEVNTNFQDRPISMTPIGQPEDALSLVVFPFFVKQDPGVKANHVRVFLHQGGSFVGASQGKMPQNLKLFEGETKTLNGIQVGFIKPEVATGLLIKKSPETLWIYLAFAIICIGTVMCFFSQRQIWVALEPPSEPSDFAKGESTASHTLYFHWKTNKAHLSFNKELDALKQTIYECVQPKTEQGVTP